MIPDRLEIQVAQPHDFRGGCDVARDPGRQQVHAEERVGLEGPRAPLDVRRDTGSEVMRNAPARDELVGPARLHLEAAGLGELGGVFGELRLGGVLPAEQ